MEFVRLSISPTKRYFYKGASTIEMNILGDFLASDVGYRSASFKEWVFNYASQNACGNLTALKKNDNDILLSDLFSEKQPASVLKIPCQQFMQLLTEWQEKVCNSQPQEIVIKHDNNQFIIETNFADEDYVTESEQRPGIIPHLYPLWIKISFLICCIIFLISLFNFPYYFKLHKKVQKARKAFVEKDYFIAAYYFTRLSNKLPTNNYMKRYLAQSLFMSDDVDDHQIALDALSGVTLKKKEWQELLTYMPAEYADFFKTVTRR
jgi:hypothetical protein